MDFAQDLVDDAVEVRTCVPIRLRVVSYDHDDVSPEDFPTIKIQGEMGGEGWRNRDEDDPDDNGDQRFADGTVSLLADGHVRWSMVCVLICE